MTTGRRPICLYCRHWASDALIGEPFHCTAYPTGIPEAIIFSVADHRQPYPNDQGIQYAVDPDNPPPAGYFEDLFAVPT